MSNGALITGGKDGTVSIWHDGNQTEHIDTPMLPGGTAVRSVCFSADRKKVAISTGLYGTGMSGVWSRQEESWLYKSEELGRFAFSAFGSEDEFVYGCYEGQKLFFRYGASLDKEEHIDLEGTLVCMTANPDKSLVATVTKDRPGNDKIYRLSSWEIATRELRWSLPIQGNRLWCIGYDPGGKYIAIGDHAGIIRLVQTQQQQVVAEFPAHGGLVRSIDFSPCGKQISTCSLDEYVHIWDIDKVTRSCANDIVPISPPRAWIAGSAFVSDETLCTTDGTSVAHLWDAKTGTLKAKLTTESDDANHIQLAAAASHGLIAVTCGHWPERDKPGTVAIWDVTTGTQRGVYDVPDGIAYSQSAFSPDGKLLAVCSRRHIVIISVEEHRLEHRIDLESSWAKSVAFSPDGNTLAFSTGSEDKGGRVHLRRVEGYTPIETLTADGRVTEFVGFAPDGKTIVTCGSDRTIKLFDARTYQAVGPEFETRPGFPTFARFSPDGTRILSGHTNGKVRLWTTDTGDEVFSHSVPFGWFPVGEFSPSGDAIAIAAGEEAYVLHAADGGQLKTLSVTELKELVCNSVAHYR